MAGLTLGGHGCLCLLPCTILTQLCKGGIYILLSLPGTCPRSSVWQRWCRAPKTTTVYTSSLGQEHTAGRVNASHLNTATLLVAGRRAAPQKGRQDKSRDDGSPSPDPTLACASASLSSRRRGFKSLGREDPLEKGMATHSSILAWKTP